MSPQDGRTPRCLVEANRLASRIAQHGRITRFALAVGVKTKEIEYGLQSDRGDGHESGLARLRGRSAEPNPTGPRVNVIERQSQHLTASRPRVERHGDHRPKVLGGVSQQSVFLV